MLVKLIIDVKGFAIDYFHLSINVINNCFEKQLELRKQW